MGRKKKANIPARKSNGSTDLFFVFAWGCKGVGGGRMERTKKRRKKEIKKGPLCVLLSN